MARTKIFIFSFLLAQIDITLPQPWNYYQRPSWPCYPGPVFRTFSRNPYGGLPYLDARSYLTALPQVDEPPIKPNTDTTYTPEPQPVSNKTKAILHKLHKTVQELLESEAEDEGKESDGIKQVIIEPASLTSTSTELDDNDEVKSYDDEENNGSPDNGSEEKILSLEITDSSIENSVICYSDESNQKDSGNTIKINISVVRCNS